MAKTKTSSNHAAFSINDLPIVKLKDPRSAVTYSPSAILRDRTFTAKALVDALMSSDKKAFLEIFKNHFEALNTAKALKEAKLRPRTFYQAISESGNPSLATIMKMMKVVGK